MKPTTDDETPNRAATADTGVLEAAKIKAKDKEKAKKKKKKKKKVDPLSNLAEGWVPHYNEEYKRYYYINSATQETTWEKPEAPPGAAEPAPPTPVGSAPPPSSASSSSPPTMSGPPLLRNTSSGNLQLPGGLTLPSTGTSSSPPPSPSSAGPSSGGMGGDPATAVPSRVRTRNRAASTSGIRGFHLTPEVRQEVEKHSMIKWGKTHFRELKKPKTSNPIAEVLAYSRDKLPDTIVELPKALRKVALNQWKYVQQYIGDLKTKTPPIQTLLKFVNGCFEEPGLHNEMFIYCVRATNNNPVKTSALKAWELFALCAHILTPQQKLSGPIQAYCLSMMDSLTVPALKLYASFCFRRLYYCSVVEEMPSQDLIERMIREPVKPSTFGGQLEDLYVYELSKNPNATVPRVLTALTSAIEAKGGFQTEGIFRVPADAQLLERVRQGMQDYSYDIPGRDALLPAALLKLWFREMASPCVPIEFYKDCIKARNSYEDLRTIIDRFPPVNAAVLEHLIVFLKRMAAPEVSSVTLLGADNLALVFAPNVLRPRDADPALLFANASFQEDFMRTLINGWE